MRRREDDRQRSGAVEPPDAIAAQVAEDDVSRSVDGDPKARLRGRAGRKNRGD